MDCLVIWSQINLWNLESSRLLPCVWKWVCHRCVSKTRGPAKVNTFPRDANQGLFDSKSSQDLATFVSELLKRLSEQPKPEDKNVVMELVNVTKSDSKWQYNWILINPLMTINNRTTCILHIVWATVNSFYAFTDFTGKLDAPWIWYVPFWVMFICFDDRQFLHLRCDPTRWPWFWKFFDQQKNRTVNLSKVHQIEKNHLKASKYFGIFYQPRPRIPYIHLLL